MQNYLVVWKDASGEGHSAVVEANDETHARALVPSATPDAQVIASKEVTDVPVPETVTVDARTQQYPGYLYNETSGTWEVDPNYVPPVEPPVTQ